MRMRLILVLVLLLLGGPQLTVLKAEQPTTAPAARLDAVKRIWIGLDDPDPGIREKSRQKLYTIGRDDLPALKLALEFFRPLDASQIALAKDAVTHVYLRGESYDHSDEGFLGIRMLRNPVEGGDEVVIEERIPGFCSYSALQDGDAILDIEERPLRQPVQRIEFQAMIKSLRPGTEIHLKARRNGQELRIPIKLDGWPVDRDAIGAGVFDPVMIVGRRAEAAEKYWKENFAPVVEEKEKVTGAAPR